MWKMTCFGLKLGQDLKNRAAHPYREFRGVPPPPPRGADRITNDVPLMEPITPHYASLGLLKLPDIVKLKTCVFASL